MMSTETSDAVSYPLPDWPPARSHRTKCFGNLGGVLLVMGALLGLAVTLAWISGQAGGRMLVLVGAPVALLMLIPGITFVVYASNGGPARHALELTAQALELITELGAYRRRRRIAWGEVGRLVVAPALNVREFINVESGFVLQVERMRGAPVLITGDDDRFRLLNLADELDRWAKASAGASAESLAQPPRSPVTVVEEASRGVVFDRDKQPKGSRALVEQHADGVTITIPPLGLGGCIQQPKLCLCVLMVSAAIAWIVVTAVLIVPEHGLRGLITTPGSVLALPIAAAFTPLLILRMIAQAQLSARDGVLTVQWTNLLGNHCRAWPREDLGEICAVSERVSEGEGGTQWSQHLAIRPHDFARPAPPKLLSWCEKPELEWIATTIRRALPLPGDKAESKPAPRRWDDELA